MAIAGIVFHIKRIHVHHVPRSRTIVIKKAYRIRILLAFMAVLLYAGALCTRLYYLQYHQRDYWESKADSQQTTRVQIKPHRGKFYSRNLHVLATSTLMDTIYVNPKLVESDIRDELAEELSEILNVRDEKIIKILQQDRRWAIARKVTKDKADAVRDLSLRMKLHDQAIYFVQESKRHYPMGDLLAHAVGFTTFDDYGDNKGLAGLERQYNEEVRGSLQRQEIQRILGSGALRPVGEAVVQATRGRNLVLTIDENIQHIAQKALLKAVDKYRAIGGTIVVQHTPTGEILAMASIPTFDPNAFSEAPDFKRRNRAITDTIEPGSVMKIFASAALFEEGLIEPEEEIDCKGGRARFGRRWIYDAPGHRLDMATFREAFQWSSNVGLVSASQRLSEDQIYNYYKAFGFGQRTGIDLPGEAAGLLYPPSKWSKLSATSLPMGYEVMATAIQTATAVSAIGNNGVLVKPRLVREIRDSHGRTLKRFEPEKVRRVVSSLTAKKVLSMMESVVREGTGEAAAISGYRVAGKTGTTMKVDPETGTYANIYIASFAGIYPADDPQLTIYCYVDEPQGKKYGGDVAAPVCKTVAEHALRVMGIPPSQDVEDAAPDVEIVLDQVKQIAESETAPDSASSATATIAPGRMPNLIGMTMRESFNRLDSIGARLKFTGSGRVVKQTPSPNDPIEPNQICEVVFQAD